MACILGLGDNTIDTYIDAGVQYPGGNAVNVAVLTARLGARSAYLGCVGDDDGGALLRTALTAEGVDLSHIRTRAGANARAFIGHKDGDRQFIGSSPGVRADYRWNAADFAYIATFDHVHISIYSDLGDGLPRIAAAARSLSFDASDRWHPACLQEVLPHIRFAFLSASGSSDADAVALAQECLALGPEIIVLTRGSAGALGLDAAGPVFQAALPATVVDTMAAGDGFIAGFLTAKLAGASMHQAMTSGAEFAARVCGWQGGFGHAAPWSGDAAAARAGASR